MKLIVRSIYFKLKRYVGDKEASSMAIVALRLPTGWEAVEHTVESLKEKVDLRRHEINENRVHLYFDQVKILLFKLRKNIDYLIMQVFNS